MRCTETYPSTWIYIERNQKVKAIKLSLWWLKFPAGSWPSCKKRVDDKKGPTPKFKMNLKRTRRHFPCNSERSPSFLTLSHMIDLSKRKPNMVAKTKLVSTLLRFLYKKTCGKSNRENN